MNKKIQRTGLLLAVLVFVTGTAWSDSVSDRRQCDRTCFLLSELYDDLSSRFQKDVNSCQARFGNIDWVSDRDAADRFHRCDDALREFDFAATVWETKVCRMSCVEGNYDFVRATDWKKAGLQAYGNYQKKWSKTPLNEHFELDLTSIRLEEDGIAVLHEAIRQSNQAVRTAKPAKAQPAEQAKPSTDPDNDGGIARSRP